MVIAQCGIVLACEGAHCPFFSVDILASLASFFIFKATKRQEKQIDNTPIMSNLVSTPDADVDMSCILPFLQSQL